MILLSLNRAYTDPYKTLLLCDDFTFLLKSHLLRYFKSRPDSRLKLLSLKQRVDKSQGGSDEAVHLSA
jgi:hypothetical protein